MASLQPATSENVDLGMSLEISLALDLPNCMTPRPPPPWTLFISHRNTRMISTNGSTVARIDPSTLGLGTSVVYSSISPAATCLATSTSISSWVSVSQ